VYFIDVPDAKQSVIRVGRLALSRENEDYNNLNYTNQIIGGGASGRLFQLLRIEKGYTYGAYSRLEDTREIAPWTAYTSVRANVTLESMKLMRDLLENYEATFGENEMEITKNKIIKGSTRAFESLGSKLNMLRNMSKFNLPADYVQTNQQELLNMSLEDFHKIIETYLDEDSMFYLVVGDAKTQLKQMKEFGYGAPVQLDIYGNLLN
jgi:zinc protease